MKWCKISIPLIINGTVKKGSQFLIEYINRGIFISMPKISDKDVKKLSYGQKCNFGVTVDEIVYFLSQVRDLWADKNYELRKEAINIQEKITPFSREQIERDYKLMCDFLSPKLLYKMVDIEIGNHKYLDSWIKIGNVEVRAMPRGRILHIVAGNLPSVGVASLVRGILTKNSNILKLPSSNPISTLYFVLSFRDVDKNHPITRTVSVLYWERNSPLEEEIFNIADMIITWGGKEAIFSSRKKSRPGQPLLEFGPKYSVYFISKDTLRDEKLLKDIAKKATKDIILHDQRACFSPSIAFVEGQGETFCNVLSEALMREEKRIKKHNISLDKMAQIAEIKNIHTIIGDKVYRPSGTNWTIILVNNVNRIFLHPFPRIFYVVEVKNIEDALKYIDEKVMVVGFSSKSKLSELKTHVVKKGVERITMVGKMDYPPPGSPSGHTYPLSLMVRWVSRDILPGEVYKDVKRLVKWIRI